MPLESLSIGQLAQRTGSNAPTIRYYEEIGLLPKAARNAGGQRVYSEEDRRRLQFIRRCREFGFAIDQVRALSDLMKDGGRNCIEARDIAQGHLQAVREKMREMRALEVSLSAFVASCNRACAGGPANECVIFEDLASSNPCGHGCNKS